MTTPSNDIQDLVNAIQSTAWGIAYRELAAILDQAAAPADSRWFASALAAVEHVARTQATFSADDVWRELPLTQWGHVAHESRALGAVMREAVRRGWCVNTRTVKPSVSLVNHHRPIYVWKSKILRR